MSFKHRREITSFSCLILITVCHSVSLGQREADLTAYRDRESDAGRRGGVQQGEPVTRSPDHAHPDGLQPGPADFIEAPLSYLDARTLDLNRLTWTNGDVRPKTPVPVSKDGYQADFTGPDGVQGKVLGLSSDSSPHFSEWQAMRPLVQCDANVMIFTASGGDFTHLLVDREGASPISLFQLPSYCGYSVRMSWSDLEMMVPYDACYITQENGSYVLPLLWWGNPLKLSCPVQMSTTALSLPPSVFCSPYGMAVQVRGQEQDVMMLGVRVNGAWAPLVTEECAHRVQSDPGQLLFFIPYSALCVTAGAGPQISLHFIFDEQEYILSCPVGPQFPLVPSPPPSDPQYPIIPDPVSPAPPAPPAQPPTQEQTAQLPEFQYPQLPQVYPPGPQPARPPQPTPGSPPGSQQPQPQQEPQQEHLQLLLQQMHEQLQFHRTTTTQKPIYIPPHPQQQQEQLQPQQQQESSSQQISEFLAGQDPPAVYYPYAPFYYYPAVTPAATKTTTIAPPPTQAPIPPQAGPYYPQYYLQMPHYPTPTAAPVTQQEPQQEHLQLLLQQEQLQLQPHQQQQLQPQQQQQLQYYPLYYLQMPHYPPPTAAPVTQAPAPLPPSPLPPPPPPPKQPEGPQYPVGAFYHPAFYSSYYHYGQFPYHPTIAPPSPATPPTTRTMIPKQPDTPSYTFNKFYPQKPIYIPPPTPPPPAKEKPQTTPQEPAAPPTTCTPYTHTLCSYPYVCYPHHHPLYPPHCYPSYPPAPQYPQTPPPMSTGKPFTTSTATTTIPCNTSPTPTTATTTASTSAAPTPQYPHLQCLMGRMVAFLPFAHPESIQVRDQRKSWLFLSGVSPLCGYVVQTAADSGVILHSPLPACHSEPRTPTTISLPLRFWDLSVAHYRTLDLQCPHQTPLPVIVPPTPPSTTTTTTTTTTSGKVGPKPKVFCSSHQMTVELPPGPISGIAVKDIKGNRMNLQDVPKHCGYSAKKGKDGKVRLSLQLHSGCHMSVQGKTYIITVLYETANGRREARLFCPVLIPSSGDECNLPSEQRLPCGHGSVSEPQCLSMGCCFSEQPPACYYRMDECTIDRHFVFSVPASLTEPPLSPALLVAADNSTCQPQRVTSNYALFKIPMDGCGARRVMLGKTVVYLVEIVNKVQTISLNYGTITRETPIRLLVECRYLPGTVLTVGYMVKTPSIGSAVHTQGVFGVQLRIAKDAQYSSYYPQYHQPLQMLLGKPLYLEVRLLNTPDPSLVLLVHYCVAYPRSGKAAWLLLYNGCPNPLDPASQQAVLLDPRPPSPQAQTRRFTVSTFQFLPDGEFKDPEEEIYFMCSTEICSPRDGPCVEGCFGQ